jgi:hypothetical protein
MARILNVARRAGTPSISESVADQVLNAVDTYVDGTTLPFSKQDARSVLKWRLWMTKTAAGVAAPSFKVRIGTLATIVDTARLTFATAAQTAAVDTAWVEILAILRTGGAAAGAVLAGCLRLLHNGEAAGAGVGFANIASPVVEQVSAGFDSTVRDQVVGISIDPGAAGVWTVRGVTAEITNT